MKRILLIASIGIAAACAREPLASEPSFSSDGLSATIIREKNADTKVQFLDNPGIRMESRWAEGDKIGVFSSGKSNILYTIGEISYGGKQALFRTDGAIPAGALTAVCPYQENAQAGAGKIRVNFPAGQTYTLNRYVSAPDPAAFIMAGSGSREDGLSFYCVTSLLKIGYTAPDNQVIKKIIFTDLDGKAVNGPFDISWDGDLPEATLDAGGTDTITLDCGEGVLVTGETTAIFWIPVPAREFAKGFKLTFVLKDGSEVVRTVGTTYGKTLYRGTVHPVGDVTTPRIESADISYALKDNVLQVNQKNMDLIKDATLTEKYVESPAVPGTYAVLGFLDATVHKDLGLKSDDYVIFNQASDLLPTGFVGKVTEYTPIGDEIRVTIRQCEDISEPFRYLHVGKPIYAEDGSFLESGGIELDLASTLERIETPDGQDLPFDVEGDTLTLYEPPTKAVSTSSYTSPRLKLKSWKENGDSPGEMTAGVQLKLTTKFSMGSDDDGNTEFLHFNVNPKALLTFNVKFSGSHDFESLKGEMEFGTFYFAPITVGPLLLRPAVEIGAYCSASASVEMAVSYKYVANWGHYGFSYFRGKGFSMRCFMGQPDQEDGFSLPEASLAGNLGISVGLYATPAISLYGLITAKLQTKLGLNFSTGYEVKLDGDGFSNGLYFQIAPEFSLQPQVTTLGGVWTKTWEEMQPLDFDPIWQKYLWPEAKIHYCDAVPDYGEERVFKINIGGEMTEMHMRPITGYNKIHYNMEVRKETLFTTAIGVAIYRAKSFYHANPSDLDKNYIAAGLEDYTSFTLGALVDPEYVRSIPFEPAYTGPGNEDSMVLQGEIDYEFENGYYYTIVPDAFLPTHTTSSIFHYDYGDIKPYGTNRHSFVCHWPYLSNGEPFPDDMYKEEESN